MKNKYSKEFEDFFRENISKYKKEEFILLLEKTFNIKMSKNAFRSYLRRHNIKGRHIDFKKNMVRSTQKHPIGAEIMTKDGILIKVAQPDVWKRKSRVMYEKYHNCKLTDDDYIIFLNHNRDDFSKKNLMKSNKREMAYLHNCETFSKNPELTKTGILSARLKIKANDKIYGNSKMKFLYYDELGSDKE